MKRSIILLTTTLTLLFANAVTSYAQVTVERNNTLNFGEVLVGSNGSITMSAQSDSPSVTGGVVLYGSGSRHRAEFTFYITRIWPRVYINYLSIATSIPITGSDGGSAEIETYFDNDFGYNYYSYSPNVGYKLYIGGKMNLNNNMTPGDYSGQFTVSYNYQ